MFGLATRSLSTLFVPLFTLSSMFLSGCGAASAAALPASVAQQGLPSVSNGTSNTLVAYLYVSKPASGGKVEIDAFSVSASGTLLPVSGSPFSTDLTYGASMVSNRSHLFFTDGVNINSYAITPTGALKPQASINAQQFNQSSCGGPVALFFDRSGVTLYDLDVYSDCANNGYQFFTAQASSGDLSYLGVTAASSPIFEVPLSFLSTDQYAYGSSCYHWSQQIFGFQRNSGGALTDMNIAPAMPTARAGQMYCPVLAAADATNNIAVPMQPLNSSSLQPAGPTQLSTYTANSAGSLITKSTYSNMPKVAVVNLLSISAAPSGKFLAVAGTGGLQVFHFNGANPITPYTGLLTTDQIDQIAWDNAGHLYAVSQSAGKIYVYSITPTTVTEASGSPHKIATPGQLTVVSK